MKILIVNDSETIQETIGAMITRTGHETEFASDGNEALRKYRDHGPYDLVLSDVDHPGPDGLELLHTILQQNPSQQVGFVASVHGLPRSGLLAAVPLLRIPFERTQLLEFVSSFNPR